MVESVDTKDLKSFGLNSRAGSSPASSTGSISYKSMICKRFSFFMQSPLVNLEKHSFLVVLYGFLRSLCKPMCKPEIKIKSNSLLQIRTVQ